MTSLHQRAYRLVVQDREVKGLDIEFKIDRSIDQTQNTAEITVFNLGFENRKHLQQVQESEAKQGGVVVRFEAGYQGVDPTQPTLALEVQQALTSAGLGAPDREIPLLFLGRLRGVTSAREGADWVTKISTGDGDKKNKRISFSVGAGTEVRKAIEQTAKEIGSGLGNLKSTLKDLVFPQGAGTKFPNGAVMHGRADHELTRLLASVGHEWSVQNDDLQITPKGKPVNRPAHVVSDENGLVGSPELGRDNKGVAQVKFKSLLTGEIFPGRQVYVKSEQVDAYFRVTKTTYIGQWVGNDWYVEAEATPL